ncbi:MAG TPA: NAD-dependent epimerase/dehydratase family protein, partial [Planctomycetota bacterium]|nr:NAD-dependent epimerase/dehydratase family protein [Planctomycetota bacterium]
VGAASVRRFASLGFRVVGIDNDMRKYFFGAEASTDWSRRQLEQQLPAYVHHAADIRDAKAIDRLFAEYGTDVKLVIHCASQPSHDWAAREPMTDFSVNATGTLVLLEAMRKSCDQAVFIFMSTNKVYGDTPNCLPLVELETRWEVAPDHAYHDHGIDETMSIDQTKHSLFGASKVAADVMVQEYGQYFGMKTAVFRGGCLTGPGHSGAQLHGFLSYLMKCCIAGSHYTVFGYRGKQVRDNIHCSDLVSCFEHFYRAPRKAEVYNIGGSRHSNCSMLEAIALCEEITGKQMRWSLEGSNRIGDHIWWISDVRRFQRHYPGWSQRYALKETLIEIHDELTGRSRAP